MNRLILNIALCAPVALALCTADALASTQAGQIAGTVSTPDGAPAARATVQLSGKELIGGVREQIAAEDGTYRFTQLPPGHYQLVARRGPHQIVKAEQILVRIGRTAKVDLRLAPTSEERDLEEIVVVGSVSVIDTERVSLGTAITDTFAETVPTDRTYQGMAQLVPGVVGGGNPNVLGGTEYGNQYLLDGINISDPVVNTFSSNFNFDAIKSVEVLTGGRDAEYGSAVGGVVNIVTRSGSNEHQADASVYFQSSAMQLKEKSEEGLKNQSLQANLNVGGPIIKDKLWYYVSAETPWTQSSLPEPEGGSIFPDRQGKQHPAREFLGFYALGKLTWQPASWQTFQLLAKADPASISNTLQDPTVHPDAERKQVQTGYLVALTSKTFLTPELFWNNQVALVKNRLQIQPQLGDADTPGHTNTETGTSTVNDTRWTDDKRTRMQLHSALSYALDGLLGEHQLKVGVDAWLTLNSVSDTIPGGGYYDDSGLDPTDPGSISAKGLPSQYTKMVDAQKTTIFGDTEALFLQDVWKPFATVTVRPGVRFDSARMRNFEGETQIHLNTLSPRIGVCWDPFDDGRTALRAGYYQYVDTGFLALSDFAGGRSTLTRTYEYNPVTGGYDVFLREQGGATGAVGKDYLKDALNQRRPRTHELIVGGSRELVPDLELSVDFTYRFSRNQWEDDEANVLWNDTGDAAIGFVDGQQRFIYSLGALEEAFIRYYGVEVAMNKRFSRNWEMLASYTWSKTEGTEPGVITVAFDRPRQREYEYGYLPHDHRHVLKLYGSYRLPYGLVLGGRVLYQSGGPYNRYFFNSFFNDYNDRRAPRGSDTSEDGNGAELRLPDRFTINARLMWRLEELTGQNIDLIVEAFNLLNARTASDVEQRNLPAGGATQFADVTDKLDPFNVQVGMRLRY